MNLAKLMTNYIEILAAPFNEGRKVFTTGKIFFWKMNQIFFHLPVICLVSQKTRCICYPDSSYGSLVVYQGIPESTDVQALLDEIKKGDVFIDVGANIGLISLLATEKNPQKVYAFEADCRVVDRLEENIALNLKNDLIVVINEAVTDRDGYISFVEESHSEVSHIRYSTPAKSKTSQRIACTKLDTFIDKKKIKAPLVIKIDVEGAEYMVLKGMEASLKRHQVSAILFEANENSKKFNSSFTDVFSLLTTYGYKLYVPERNIRIAKPDQFVQASSSVNVLAIL